MLASWSIVHGLAALIVDGPASILPTTTPEIEALAGAVVTAFVEGVRAR